MSVRTLGPFLFSATLCCGQIITTVAGGGNPNVLGDGGQATLGSLNAPCGVAFDAAGNMYIADFGNNRIRKVTPAGVISTVAGNGKPFYAGDNGPATLAQLYYPIALALDAAGNLYIADQYDHRVRKVSTNGTITTLAGTGDGKFYGDGGPATQAALNYPAGLAVDSAGNVYISDAGNNRIRKVDTRGIITTVAGSGNAGFSGDGGPAILGSIKNPSQIALDRAGNLFIADHDNGRVRRVAAADGTISTVAGGGSTLGDGGPATFAELYWPSGIAIDPAGNIYIADAYIPRIREVTTDGMINTVAGNGNTGFTGDLGPATSAEVNGAQGLALDSSGSLYIADSSNNRIRKVYFPAGTTTSLSSSVNPSQFGQSVTLTAAITPPGATGSVSFREGSTVLGSGAVSGGAASLTISNFSPGSHSLMAIYSGDPNYATSTSVAFLQTVNPAATVTMLSSSANPAGAGQSLTLTATITPSGATGTVTFMDGDATLSTSSVTNGAAAVMLPGLSVGAHTISATYSGDGNYAASSGTLVETVNKGTTTTTLTVIPSSAVSGQSLTLTATVSPNSATGSVTFNDGASPLGSSPLDSGTATLALSSISVGTHSLSATYGGDANYATSISPAGVKLTVNGPIPATPCSPIISYLIGQPAPAPVVCQFTAISAASFNVGTTTSWLQVTPSSGQLSATPTAFSLLANPAGLAVGTYPGNFTISGPQLGSLTIPVQLIVDNASPLLATPTTLSFNYRQGSQAPAAQSLIVSSSFGAQLPFSVATSGGSWLVAGIGGGNSPVTFNVFVSPIGLDPNTYSGTVTISSPNVQPVTVNVNLTVTASVPPALSLSATPVNLSGFQGGAAASAQVQVSNSGGGVLNFTASTSGGKWLTVSPASGTVDNTQSGTASPVSLTITANPSSLAAGTYQGSVTITGAGNTFTVPVTFSIAAAIPKILVSQSGLSFTAVAQGGAPISQQIGVLNVGTGPLNWSANVSTLSGGNWLLLSTAGGNVQQPFLDVSTTDVMIDPSVAYNLDPGDYYGQIQISGPSAINSPQLVTVILTVLPPGSDAGPEVQPSSLIFTGTAGSAPNPQNVVVGIRKAVGDQFVSSHIPGAPFNYSPQISPVQPNQPITLQVMPDFSTLNPSDIKRDTITLQFNDGTPRTVSLLTVVAPDASSSLRLSPDASSSCGVLNLQWRTPAPPIFAVVQGHGQTLELQVVDSCGNLIGPSNPKSAAVVATFSNKDADLNLVHVGNGVWTGTWKPVNPSSAPVAVIVTAFNSTGQGLQSGQASALSGTVLPGTTPLVTAGGVQQGASYVLGAPIAPGTLITLKGLNLADSDSTTSGLPLPTTWNGTQVFMGTEALPLLYSGAGQVNVQVPFDVPVDTQFQVTVQRDNVQSLPEQLVIAAAQPGIFTVDSSGSGQGVIYHSDGVTLAQPGSPATAGETITIYCTGLGAVNPPVPAGAQPPSSPISTTTNPVSVTIGGLDGKATSGTLVPGQPGVYSVSAIVPSGVTGGAVPLVVTVAGQISPPATMAIQ